MDNKTKFITLVVLILGLPLLLYPRQKIISVQRIDITHLPEIHCYFTVTDEEGQSILGFTKEEIQITIDGVFQKLTSLISALQGKEYLAVALLFDRSGSMKSAFEDLKDAAADFIQRLSVDDVTAIISFDDTVRIDSPFTEDRELTENALRGINMGRNTALYDAIQTALDLLEDIETGRQAIVIFSDGLDTRSQLTRSQVLQNVKDAEIPLYVIGLGDKVDETNLIALSSETGGRYFRAATSEELVLLYQTIAEQLKNQYLAAFVSTFGKDERWHSLNITLKEPSGEESVGEKKYIATQGPGVSRELVTGFERKAERQNVLLLAGIGALLGLLLGVILLLIIKLTRPERSIPVAFIVGIILCTMILGAILAVFTGTVLKQ
ncbi:MAG: VWA domain-containing protein [Candidatus Aminicenantes bacterium]|jgi:VWFA-related protein